MKFCVSEPVMFWNFQGFFFEIIITALLPVLFSLLTPPPEFVPHPLSSEDNTLPLNPNEGLDNAGIRDVRVDASVVLSLQIKAGAIVLCQPGS